VAEFPAWVKLFQNRLIATDVSEFRGPLKLDMQATQRLIQAYLNSFNRKTGTNFHSSLEEFYFHVGKSETNGQAIALGGARGNDDWCAGASYRALVRGLYRHGLQFKVPPKRKPPTVKKVYDIVGQSLALVRWMEQKGNTTRLGPGDATAVQPGDIITLVSGGMDGPLSGHVATVVKESGGVIYIVSGNAAGTGVGWGSVRVEQVKRETIPPGYDYERIAKHSNDYAIEKKEYKRLLKEWNALEPELKQPGLDPAKIDDIMARSRATREKWDASKGRKDDIRKKAAKEGLPVERMDLDNFTPDPLFALGTHAPAAPDTSWVVKISHTSKLDASSGRLQDPAIESGTPLDQMPDGDPEFSPS
jgi:hypothetical protein